MSKNPRITPKERNLLKGSIRRVFSRSELRQRVLKTAMVVHYSSNRPRVTKWSKCNLCKRLHPQYTMNVDHIEPIIPVTDTLENMSWDTVVDRTWCKENNLQVVCEPCHKLKTKAERKLRTSNKRVKAGK